MIRKSYSWSPDTTAAKSADSHGFLTSSSEGGQGAAYTPCVWILAPRFFIRAPRPSHFAPVKPPAQAAYLQMAYRFRTLAFFEISNPETPNSVCSARASFRVFGVVRGSHLLPPLLTSFALQPIDLIIFNIQFSKNAASLFSASCLLIDPRLSEQSAVSKSSGLYSV